MRLSVATADLLVNTTASQLTAGSLVIYGDDEGQPLVVIPFQTPAFNLAADAHAVALDLPATLIQASGRATRAQLVTAEGQLVATLTVKAQDDRDVADADVLVDRTDFQRGGMCAIGRVVLRLPLGA